MADEQKRRPGRPATGQDPNQNFRMGRQRWTGLKAAAERAGTTRSAVLNDLAAWYLREPGATLPKRPAAVDDDAASVESGLDSDDQQGY